MLATLQTTTPRLRRLPVAGRFLLRLLTRALASCLPLALSACLPEGAWQPPPIANDPLHALAPPSISGSGLGVPLLAANLPQHPHLAPSGRNGMHADSYASGSYAYAGPTAARPVVRSANMGRLFGGECATVVFDRRGLLYTFCSDLGQMALYALDAEKLTVLAQKVLPLRDSNKSLDIKKIMGDTSGGAYFHLDAQDRPIIATADRKIQIFELRNSATGGLAWHTVAVHDLAGVLPEKARITDAIPDWAGNLWFVTREGVVGVVQRGSGAIHTRQLAGEEIQNALAVAADGVYLVSNYALYRFAVDSAGRPAVIWRRSYDRGTQVKPGQLDQGSGTTATLLDHGGQRWVAIADNADSQVAALVYDRDSGALLCREPLFEPGKSATDNSFIGYGNSIIAENNYGYGGPLANNWTQPGISRIDIDPHDVEGWVCRTRWTSQEASQTTVPKLSTADGLIYLYTREPIPGMGRTGQAWYLTTLSFTSGETVRKLLVGTGMNYNNNYAPITLGPDQRVYVGVLAGIVSVSER